MAERHEYVVVGAGVFGLSVARELVRRGRDVICLEQAVAGNERSGSKGRARIMRFAYHDPAYVRLAMSAVAGWRELESESDRRLLVPAGLLSVGDGVDELLETMRKAEAGGELMTAEEAAGQFPGISLPGPAVYERTAGVLLADEVLTALAASPALEVRGHHVVTRIAETDDAVTLDAVEVELPPADGHDRKETGNAGEPRPPATPVGVERTFECDAAIFCCGAWSSKVARMAGLTALADVLWPSLQQVVYVALPGLRAERLPAVVWYEGAQVSYGLPNPGYGTYKVGLHEPRAKVDPAQASLSSDDADLALLAKVTARLLPEADTEPVAIERCFYDNAPDQGFVLDRVGRLVIGAGTSGHGFKFGPVVGELLADLAEGRQPRLDRAGFTARRASLGRV